MAPAEGAAPASSEALRAKPGKASRPAEPRSEPPQQRAWGVDGSETRDEFFARLRVEKMERDRLRRAEFPNELYLPDLAAEVRQLQRKRPDARAHWAAHCSTQSGGVLDPLKHSVESLKEFLSQYRRF